MSAPPPKDEAPSAPGSPEVAGQVPESTHSEEAPRGRSEEEEGKEEEEQNKESEDEKEEGEAEEEEEEEAERKEGEKEDAPPLPDEVPPPLPNEAPPGADDGWEPVWDSNAQAFYFYNRFTGTSQWENPRVPAAEAGPGRTEETPASDSAPGTGAAGPSIAGGYNPAIHGDYDPTAPYAQQYEQDQQQQPGAGAAGIDYAAVGSFNRFTGRWQSDAQDPEYHNDENKSRRQMNAFFDVDAAANAHDGRSLRAERSAKKLSRKELKMFKEKRREKKEEKRRAWLRD